ncbi:hypothetical protein WKR88_08875 [Trinickia caryophylli]|uniref:Uncharacterized protein n=1 Tax=Trinickia caryophylli TaxID=28094 RepID=A0A1X7ED28_TRICW|nr:hypothetical protein [Trinickia caryophylli]PMS12917.1 hypothetical protein C0Z17_06355 [Trinickia caryophylli]TRX14675.1 hypothetical protein FNF07_25860 [Trinickia caryophylli]WQE14518.1 hypothetical protein U0034_28050 [Trinickia caryophylli]SMF31430.1 hypothetical protein SAMN06295900_105190 [Trinickia caryophylli]GLU32075.1 hypothetical protein Busp01_19170 [Trinickia caryophylli]
MDETWQFQIRITASAELAQRLRAAADDPRDEVLKRILREHDASLVCQYDAFADYVAQAERDGIDGYPLYHWTKATIENPQKKARYLQSFTVYVKGDQVYDQTTADSLQAKLSAHAGESGIEAVSKFDTNPANNPQPPMQGG